MSVSCAAMGEELASSLMAASKAKSFRRRFISI
jgi:hypothetical protein